MGIGTWQVVLIALMLAIPLIIAIFIVRSESMKFRTLSRKQFIWRILVVLALAYVCSLFIKRSAFELGNDTVIIVSAIAFLITLVLFAFQVSYICRRLNDAGYATLWALLAVIPGVNLALILFFCFPRSMEERT